MNIGAEEKDNKLSAARLQESVWQVSDNAKMNLPGLPGVTAHELPRRTGSVGYFRYAAVKTVNTGVKHLEYLLLVRDIRSAVCFSEMKDRGWRVVQPEDLRRVTPAARCKARYLIGDAKCHHEFHVWCQDCGEKFVVPDGGTVECCCDTPWRVQPKRPESGHIGESESISLMVRHGNETHAIYRRPIA
jgi:hypothetical protein